jgi:hypothetical protein
MFSLPQACDDLGVSRQVLKLRMYVRHLDPSLMCEFLAHWLGGTTVDEIGRLLAYSPRRITALLKIGFARRGRVTAEYDPGSKSWVSVAKSKDLHGPKTSTEAVVALTALRLWSEGFQDEALFPVVDTRSFRRDVSPDIFRTLLGACVRRRVVDVVYRGSAREFTVSFSPHTLVNTSHRLHFRGYSVFEETGRGHYWDLVPSRVLQAEVRRKPIGRRLGDDDRWRYVDAAGDTEWHTTLPLRLELRKDVPETMRQSIRHEHRMDGDQLEIGLVSNALRRYVLAELTTRRYAGFPEDVWASDTHAIPSDRGTSRAA